MLKRKQFVLIMLVRQAIYLAGIVIGIIIGDNSICQTCLVFSILAGGVLHLNGYLFLLIPQTDRYVFVASPRSKWLQCVFSEFSGVLLMFEHLSYVLIYGKDERIVEVLGASIFMTAVLIFYIYANSVPEYCIRRETTARALLITVLTIVVFAEIFLYANVVEIGITFRALIGISLSASIFIAWIVSLFLGYRCHVKAFEYGN